MLYNSICKIVYTIISACGNCQFTACLTTKQKKTSPWVLRTDCRTLERFGVKRNELHPEPESPVNSQVNRPPSPPPDS